MTDVGTGSPEPLFGLKDILTGVVLGWLLGLIGSPITDAIKKQYRKRETRRAVLAELRDIRGRLAATAGQLAVRYGTLDRDLLNWHLAIARAHRGFYSASMLAHLESVAATDDETLRVTVAASASTDMNRGFSIKKLETPYLTVTLGSLSMFPPEFERVALEIHSRLGLINGEVDAAWFFFAKTFDAGAYTESAKQNAHASYKRIGEMCKDAADLIGQLDPALTAPEEARAR